MTTTGIVIPKISGKLFEVSSLIILPPLTITVDEPITIPAILFEDDNTFFNELYYDVAYELPDPPEGAT